jgi:alpha-glucosidase
VKDPIGALGWPLEKGRDGERTPMRWISGTNAGFTTGRPWLPMPPSAKTHNLETESKEPDSCCRGVPRETREVTAGFSAESGRIFR